MIVYNTNGVVYDSHYKWLDAHLNDFWVAVIGESLSESGCAGIVSAHGDKAYSYRKAWTKAGIPFPHGVALFLLSYTSYADGYDSPTRDFVIEVYPQLRHFLPDVTETDVDLATFYADRLGDV